jgi:hypothetical protein
MRDKGHLGPAEGGAAYKCMLCYECQFVCVTRANLGLQKVVQHVVATEACLPACMCD